MKVRAFLVTLGATLALAGVANAGDAPRTLDAAACASLSEGLIAPSKIGLPTSGARMTGAELVPGGSGGAPPEHCLVSGAIRPIDPGAPEIRFRIALPTAWNGKVVMLGGGGFNGVIPNVTGTPLAADGPRSPLARGYAVFGSDSGHQVPGASFGLNEEALRNYLSDAIKKTRDAAWPVIARAYGRAPTRSYFLGASKGGGEALSAAARWPQDWDGIVALYPARPTMLMMMGMLATNQALKAPGAYPSTGKRALAFRAALERCDGLDGLKDGVIGDADRCRRVFDLADATVDARPLRCPAGQDAGDSCLSDAQITAWRTIDSPARLPMRLATGETTFEGFNILTTDTTNSEAAAPPWPSFDQVDQSMRFVVARDPNFSAQSFDFKRPGALGPRMFEISTLDPTSADFRGFARRGGRLMIVQGSADLLVSPRSTTRFYHELRGQLGAATLQKTVRYYLIPGYGHGSSPVFNARWDKLGALDAWVDRDVDPAETGVMTDRNGSAGRTRPICLYPRWPRYRGQGDVNSASSFTCASK